MQQIEERKEALLNYIKQLATVLPTEVNEGARIETDLGIKKNKTDELIRVLTSEYEVTFSEEGLKRFYHNSWRKSLIYTGLVMLVFTLSSFILFFTIGSLLPSIFLVILALLITYNTYLPLSKKMGYKSHELKVHELLEAVSSGKL